MSEQLIPEPYIYLFVRKDLSVPQQVIQTVHAAQLTGWACGNLQVPNAVLVGAQSEDDLLTIREYLIDHDVPHEMFYEPDVFAYTAIATYPLKGKERAPLKHFQLMR
jgi:hypothetical protein